GGPGEGERHRLQLGDAAHVPAQRRRDRQHPHLRLQQLGQRGRRVRAGGSGQNSQHHGAAGGRGALMAGPRAALLLAGLLLGGAAHAAEYRAVPGGELRSVLPPGAGMETVTVAPYALRETPVTNGEFLAFVTRHPGWRRGEVPALFADRGYLEHWSGPLSLGAAAPRDAPV